MPIERNIINGRYHHPPFFLYVTATAMRLRHSRHLDVRSQFLGEEELPVSASRFILHSISHPSLSSSLSHTTLYHLHSFPPVSDINSFYEDDLPRSSYKPSLHRVYNRFVPSLSSLIFRTIKYLSRARVSSPFYVTSTSGGSIVAR